MTKVISAVLIFLLLPSAGWAETRTPQEQVLRLKPGATVEVRLKTEKTLRGKLGQVDGEEFELTQKRAVPQRLAFADVKSVKQAGSKKKTLGFVVLGVAVGGALLMALALHQLSNDVWHFPD